MHRHSILQIKTTNTIYSESIFNINIWQVVRRAAQIIAQEAERLGRINKKRKNILKPIHKDCNTSAGISCLTIGLSRPSDRLMLVVILVRRMGGNQSLVCDTFSSD